MIMKAQVAIAPSDEPPILHLQRYLAGTSSRLHRHVKLDTSDDGIRLTGTVLTASDAVLAQGIVAAVLPGYQITNDLVWRRTRWTQWLRARVIG